MQNYLNIIYPDGNQPSHFCHEVGLFSKPFHIDKLNSFKCKYSLENINLIVQNINLYISSFEGLECLTYNERKKYWILEYGKEPLTRLMNAAGFDLSADYVEMAKQQRLVYGKKWWATKTSWKAQEKFPHNIDNEDYNENCEENPLKWTKFDISMYYDKEDDTIIVEFHKPYREIDYTSFYYFKDQITSVILQSVNLKCDVK
jgi:hypothetical protein